MVAEYRIEVVLTVKICKVTCLLLLLAALVAGCHGNAPVSKTAPVDAPGRELLVDEYRIGVDDLVLITVWRNEDLSVQVPVRPDGMISVPLVGDVMAGGRTPEEVAEDIRGQLASYIKDPIVSVILTEINSDEYLSRVRVTGAVVSPIALRYRQGMTVLDAVLEAGGVTEFAAPERSLLFRREGQDVVSYPVELRSILNRGRLQTNYGLRPGDVITVPERTL